IICSPMTSLKTSIKTITYLSDIGCLEIQGASLKISTSNGDKAYCEAIKSAAHKAKFPTFNNPEVYRDFQKSGFDMRG
ncbi:hypothetical protein ACVUSQ_24150, partial [Escherichia coli]